VVFCLSLVRDPDQRIFATFSERCESSQLHVNESCIAPVTLSVCWYQQKADAKAYG
jgi:predicted secreted acid phosphatase